jgi:hypothetical protein
MSELKLLVIAVLLWGTSNLASANTNSADDLKNYKTEIGKRVDKLNSNVPDLKLRERMQPVNIPAAMLTLSDVLKLENALKGVEEVPDHSLTTLSCARALCADGDE